MIYWLKSWKKHKYHFPVPKKWFYSFAYLTTIVGNIKIQLLTSFEQNRWKNEENMVAPVISIPNTVGTMVHGRLPSKSYVLKGLIDKNNTFFL
jgi:hypothetical protein